MTQGIVPEALAGYPSYFFEERLWLMNALRQLLGVNHQQDLCVVKTKDSTRELLKGRVRVEKRIGSDSINGEAYVATLPAIQRQVALKFIPIDERVLQMIQEPTGPRDLLRNGILAETFVLFLCSEMVRQGILPNLPLTFTWGSCKECTFENPALNDEAFSTEGSLGCLVLFNELANVGDLWAWGKLALWSDTHWKVALFQIFAALYAMQKYFDMTHHDLHPGNVLVHRIKEGGYFHYRIDGQDYYVPNIGYVFVLWDFGYVYRPELIEHMPLDDYDMDTRYLADYIRITNSILWTAEDFQGGKVDPRAFALYSEITECYLKGMVLADLIPKVFWDFTARPWQGGTLEETSFIGNWSLDKPFSLTGTEYDLALRSADGSPGLSFRPPSTKGALDEWLSVYETGSLDQRQRKKAPESERRKRRAGLLHRGLP